MAQRVNIEVLNKAAVDVQVQNSNAINVEVPTAPRGLSAEFTANQTEIDQGQSVDFSATNAGFQYFFSIEDVGGFIFKSGKDVSHEFRNIGQFDVALTQADLNQKASGIQVKRDFIKVNQAPFLLNQPFASGATAAYSLRKLKSTATKAVRVREDSGNTETDIGFSGGTLDETALSNHCGSANGFVTKWYDQSGNGNDASNSTASAQPQIVSSGSVIKENGKPALEFDGSSTVLLANTNDITYSALSWFVIFSIDYSNSDSFSRIVTHTKGATTDFKVNGNLLGALRENSSAKLRTEFSSGSYSYSAPDNQQLLNTTIANNNQPFIRDFLNGVKQKEILNANFGTTVDKIILGANRNGNFAGKLNEAVLYYSDKLSERNNIETNINNHYSIF